MNKINQILAMELRGYNGKQLSFSDEFVIYTFDAPNIDLRVTVSVRAEVLPDELPRWATFPELVDLAAEFNGQLVAACTTIS